MDPFTMAYMGLGSIGTLLSLAQGKKAQRTVLDSTQPGAGLGTSRRGQLVPDGGNFGIPALDRNRFVDDIYSQANQGAQYDPQVVGTLAYGSAREESVRPYLDKNLSNIEGSGLNAISDRFGAEADRADTQRTADKATRESEKAGYASRGQNLQGRVQQAGTEYSERLRKIADDPNVFSQQEIDAAVGNVIANSQASFAGQQANLQADAVSRGRSKDSTAALGTILGEGQRGVQAQGVRDVLLANADARNRRQEFATDRMGSNPFLGLEGQIGLGYDNLDLAARNDITSADLQASALIEGLLKSQFGTQSQYQDMLGGANTALANFNDTQSSIPAILSEILAGRGDYNTLARAGAYDAAATRWGDIGGGLLEMGQADRQARAIADAQRSAAQMGMFGDIFGSTVGAAGNVYGGYLAGR